MPVLPLPQGPALTGINLRDVLSDLYPLLNAAAAGDLIHWTDSDLYEWLDEAAKRLARTYGVFVERDASMAIALGTPEYSVPAGHISIIHASAGTLALYAVTVQELEALDASWPTAAGPTNCFLADANGLGHVRVYPAPDATITGALALIRHRFPVAITSVNNTLSAPLALRDYFLWYALSEARRRQSDAMMPEVAEHFAGRVALMEKVIEQYWGNSQ